MAGTLLLAACGGGDKGGEADASEALPQVDESSEESSDSGEAAAAPTGPATVDLVSADVLPESDFEANLLPSVVVDDINTGRKVNFRNLVPQEKPILLWMWAPH